MAKTAATVRGCRLGFGAVCLLVGMILILTLIAIFSLVHELRSRTSETAYSISLPDSPPAPAFTRLHVDVLSIDEVQRLITLRVSGFTICTRDCTYVQKVVFFSIGANSADRTAAPPSESVTLPATSAEVSAKIALPLRGELIAYPFDSCKLTLGAVVQRVNADGSTTSLTPEEAASRLFMTVREHIPRVNMAAPRPLDPSSIRPESANFTYLYVNEPSFSRPAYL